MKFCTFEKKPKEKDKEKDKKAEEIAARKERKTCKFFENLEKFKKKIASEENCRLFEIIKQKFIRFREEYLENFNEFVGVDCFLLAKNPTAFYSGLIFAVFIENLLSFIEKLLNFIQNLLSFIGKI